MKPKKRPRTNKKTHQEHPLPGEITAEEKQRNANARQQADKDMFDDAELTAHNKNDDLDEGETARLGERKRINIGEKTRSSKTCFCSRCFITVKLLVQLLLSLFFKEFSSRSGTFSKAAPSPYLLRESEIWSPRVTKNPMGATPTPPPAPLPPPSPLPLPGTSPCPSPPP
jgi:hypothetical protein